jgi:two-component system NtrC family sensor kinase
MSLIRARASTITTVVISQLAWVATLALLLAPRWRSQDALVGGVVFLGIVAGLLSTYAGYALATARRATTQLEQGLDAERRLSATLEHAVDVRTAEIEEAQRVRQRMWWLGQQITLELQPQRVLERFLEAVVDITSSDGGAMGLLRDDGRIRIVCATGVGAPLEGCEVPGAGSAMGRVVRSGGAWSVSDIGKHRAEVYLPIHELCDDTIRGMAVVPIIRRGERIGAVTVLSCPERRFTDLELEHVTAMADLLSLALENAELVETLRQAEWRFRTLFRSAPDAVLTVLQSGRVREANDAVYQVTGLDPRQVVGRTLNELIADPDRPRVQSALESAFAGTPARLEVAMQPLAVAALLNGATPRSRIVSLAISRLPEADPPSVLLVGRDMTGEREMHLRLMESDRLAAVGELVAGVAHEVNNPLSSISAFSQLLLRDGGLSASQRESVEVIKGETLRASQVVKDLLAFARRSEPRRESVDLNSVVGRTLRMRGYQLSASNVGVELALAPDLPPVIGDPRQLQQVCLNLVTNATQAMATLGGGSLVVSTRVDEGRVILEMRDTGPGIPEAARQHVFEPFFTTKKEGEGTGLGLSVSYGIVSAHGGTIEIAETSSAGTTFRVSLPASELLDAPQESTRRNNTALVLRSALSGIRLLFVDDEAALRSGMEAFGALRGFSVVSASDGSTALEIIRRTGVDAIVCDLRMPGMDGMTFLEHLRKERPGLATRTIFLTGDVVGASAATGRPLTLGSTGRRGDGQALASLRQPVLSKPFTFEQLEEALVEVLRAAPRGAAARR